MAFNFNPLLGLLDLDIFPTTPVNETAARQQFMTLFNQVKTHMNTNVDSLVDVMDISLGTSGYIALPLKVKSTGEVKKLMIQWANPTINGTGALINFPTPFPTQCVGVFPVAVSSDDRYVTLVPNSINANSFTARVSGLTAVDTRACFFLAIGY